MKPLRALPIIMFAIGLVTYSFAQRPDLKFEHFNTRNGLVKNFVSNVSQDGKGIMWFATENGLNKFDGYNFSLYQNNLLDTNSLQSNSVRSIYEDKQKNLWIGTSKGLDLFDRKNNHFIRIVNLEKSIETVYEDQFNNLWVSTNLGDLYLVDRVSRKISLYHKADTSENNIGALSSLFEDSEGTLWYVNEKEIRIIDRANKTLTKTDIKINLPTCIFEDSKKNLWFGTRKEGLSLYNRASKKHIRLSLDTKNMTSDSEEAIFCMAEDSQGKLWIGRQHKGLDILDVDRKTIYNYHPNPSDAGSIGSHTIYSVCRDKNDNMWLGTFNGGVNRANVQKFGHYKNTGSDGKGLNHNNILSFCEDAQANIWISTDGGGLNCYDSKKAKFAYFLNDPKNPHSISNNFVTQVINDRAGFIWAGFWNGGLDKFDMAKNIFKHYRHNPKDPASLVCDNVWKIFEDSDSNLWVGTTEGLDVLDRMSGKFIHYNKMNSGLSDNSIFSIFEDNDHNLWVATANGLNRLNKKDNTFTSFFNHENDPKSISNNVILSLFQDSKDRLWICTRNGLNLYNKVTNSFTKYFESDGLPSNSLCSILEDRKGNLWISTQNGISVFNPDTKNIQNYNVKDGLQDNEFKQYAALKTTTGLMLFGGNNGYNMFNPDKIVFNAHIPPIIITDFKIFNKSVKNSENNSVLKNHISETKTITLSDKQSVFSFEFAALNYIASDKNNYSYKMEGFDEDWNFIGNAHTAAYTNLDPGKYVFRVKGSNNDGVWNNTGVAITMIIEPPYWNTWWFKTILALAMVSGIYGIVILRVNIIEKQKIKLEEQVQKQTAEVIEQKDVLLAQTENLQALHEEQQAQTEYLQTLNEELHQQKKEIITKSEEAEKARQDAERANQAKSIFLATMSHEIRTPMNGVLGMASLLAETSLSAEQQEYTDTIRTSGDALLTVINDILDFSKIESGNLELDNQPFDLRQCIEDVMDVFAKKTAEKGLDLVYQIDNQIPAQIIGDSHRLRQILLNLISNAMKFTHQGEIFVGIELLNADNNQLQLAFHIRDTGIGIPHDKLSRLFKAFSQVDSSTTRKYGGTGLGLVISERLVGLMSGGITVNSELGVGTTFSFTIKSLMNHQESIRHYVHYNTVGNEGKKVLLIDDNATNRVILKTQLEHWKLLPTLASSGSEALHILSKQERFDLVITDMQMPDMDGLQLSQQIKAKHPSLPIILLSSVGDESKKKYPSLFTSVLNKPVKQQQLNRDIHRALRPEIDDTPIENQKPDQVLTEDFATKYPLRILLADDNPINQKLAVRVLNKLGYQKIEVAQNGLEVMEKFDEQFYDVILMDVQMPEMDGLEATRLIRSKHYHQPIIISMTANAMPEDKEACLKAGMDDYISKPVKLEILVSLLEKWALYLIEKSIQGKIL